MAMFDLKDSEDINLKRCHTDDPTLVKGEGLKRLEVSDSTVFKAAPEYAKPKWYRFLLTHMLKIAGALITGLILSYLTYKFGWGGS